MAPALCAGLVHLAGLLALIFGDQSRSREIVVPISSTWLISQAPTPWKQVLVGLRAAASPQKGMLWKKVLHHRVHLAELHAKLSCRASDPTTASAEESVDPVCSPWGPPGPGHRKLFTAADGR